MNRNTSLRVAREGHGSKVQTPAETYYFPYLFTFVFVSFTPNTAGFGTEVYK